MRSHLSSTQIGQKNILSNSEILDYLEMVTEKYKIKPHIKFNTEVLKAEFNARRKLMECLYLKLENIYKTKDIGEWAGAIK